jgi:hypothetical protein
MKSDSIWKSMSGVGVVLRVTGPRRLDAAIQQAARRGVGVPQPVLRVLEHLPELLGRGVETHFVEYFGEGHLDVEVVLLDRVGHAVRLPGDRPTNDAPVRHEFRRRAVRHADHLAGPAAANLVLQLGARQAARRGRLGRRDRGGDANQGGGRHECPESAHDVYLPLRWIDEGGRMRPGSPAPHDARTMSVVCSATRRTGRCGSRMRSSRMRAAETPRS